MAPESGPAEPGAAAPAPPGDPVRLQDAATGFEAFAPPDFRLEHDAERGVYSLRSDERGVAIEYLRASSAAPPVEAARALVAQRGFELLSEQADEARALVVAKRPEGGTWTVSVRRDGPETLTVSGFGRLTDATGPERADDARVLEWVASSASGGKPVVLPEKPAEQKVEPIELVDYTTEDKMAKGKVPKEEGWVLGGSGGSLEAEHPQRGELYLGIPAFVVLPGTSSAAMSQLYPPGWVISPLLGPDLAVTNVWAELRNRLQPGLGIGGVEILSAHPQSFGPPFQAGLFEIRFQRSGAPWHGAILAATAAIPADERWLFYYSEFAVPDTDDSSVSQALLEAATAYDPSKSQGARSAAAKQALSGLTKTIQDMTSMRQQTFERTAMSWSGYFRW